MPFRDDETAVRWHHFDAPPDRRHRIEVFAAAYGLPDTAGLVDRVIERQRLTIEHVRHLAERAVEPQATWVAEGTEIPRHEALAQWSEANRRLFE